MADILLTSNEVYELRLKNKLTILSACYSASGKIYEGEGARSLGRSFLYAGSENIISSLWAASDKANKKIMSSFLEQINEGESMPTALTNAKRTYLSDASPAYKHPSYWANMVLVGSSVETSEGFYEMKWFVFTILSLLFILLIFYFLKLRKKNS